MTSRNVLLTGGNGFVGAFLAKALVARGDVVRCLARPTSDLSALGGVPVTVVHGDVTDPATLPAALDGVHTVFHLAGVRRASTRDEFLRVNAEGTRFVAEAMAAVGAKRLVLVSSLAAAGPSEDGRPRTEADGLAPTEWYGESKAEAERVAFGFEKRLEVTSCRPSRILGPGDHENLTFFKLVKKGVVLKLGGPERRLSVVDVEDVVDQLLLQADRPEAPGQAFFSSSRETTTLEGLMRAIARVLGVNARTVYLPAPGLSALGAVADLVSNVTGKRLALNRKLVRQLLAPGWTCRIDKAERLLGYAPKRTVQASLERSARWYLEAGWL